MFNQSENIDDIDTQLKYYVFMWSMGNRIGN